ncbi:Polynucleotide phosphatase/kinase, variant 2 [Balamuthia mandrillaris]
MRKGKTASSSSAKPKKPPVVNVVVLCGLPGSGKSTFATQVEDHNWVRVNQDDLGSCQECKKLMEKSLKKGKSVVIDRCNGSSGDRKMWLNEAKRLGVSADRIHVLHFATNAEDCIARVQKRQNHPTLQPERVSLASFMLLSFTSFFFFPTPSFPFPTAHNS